MDGGTLFRRSVPKSRFSPCHLTNNIPYNGKLSEYNSIMKKIIRRLVTLNLPKNRSAFLWGPRKVGKTYWLTHTLKPPIFIDLLKTDVFADYASRPSLIERTVSAPQVSDCH